MPSVCMYFQVHQPFRVSKFQYFDTALCKEFFDSEKNARIMQKVAKNCYIPANRKMLELIKRHNGAFRIAYSISGVTIEQMREYAPEALETFQELASTGCVEFLAETYYHSLCSLFDRGEFEEQIRSHMGLMRSCFGQDPKVFRNTELIYADGIGQMISDMGFKAILAESVQRYLGGGDASQVYMVHDRNTSLLLKNYELSDDIAFRFSNPDWERYPLTPDSYAASLHGMTGKAETVNLFMDYETFGEHHWAETGIFDFLDALPAAVLKDTRWSFNTPGEVVDMYSPLAPLSYNEPTSWADKDRGITAWLGNPLQKKALSAIIETGKMVKELGDPCFMEIWRKLLISDHFYYMCTKASDDGEVHSYFNAFDTPYDAFIHYMNVLRDFRLAISNRSRGIG